MKNPLNGRKAKTFLDTAGRKSKKAAAGIAQMAGDAAAKAQNALEQAQSDYHMRQLERRQMVFAEDITDDDPPRMFCLLERENTQKRDGWLRAIGQYRTIRGERVLCIFRDAVSKTNFQFFEKIDGKALYCAIPNRENIYIPAEKFWEVIRRERAAEMIEIACVLGAKHCVVEEEYTQSMQEASEGRKKAEGKVKAGLPSAKAALEERREQKQQMEERFHKEGNWTGSDQPQRPDVKWNQGDADIERLIRGRCDTKAENKYQGLQQYVTEYTSLMTADEAKRIDAVAKGLKISAGVHMSQKYQQKCKMRLSYKIEF